MIEDIKEKSQKDLHVVLKEVSQDFPEVAVVLLGMVHQCRGEYFEEDNAHWVAGVSEKSSRTF